jgi:hypothetical protein
MGFGFFPQRLYVPCPGLEIKLQIGTDDLSIGLGSI